MTELLTTCGLSSCRIKKGRFVRFENPIRLSGCKIDCNLTVGAYTYIRGGRIAGVGTIGRFCSIAPGLTIGDGQHPTDYLSTHPFQYKGTKFADCEEYDAFVTSTKNRPQKLVGDIGNDVWIGSDVTIIRGVRIGHGAVIGAGAVVTRDVAPYEIVAGVPARTVRFRFSDDVIARLLRVQWWNFSLKSLEGIRFDDIAMALDELERRASAGELITRPTQKKQYLDGKVTSCTDEAPRDVRSDPADE